MTGWRRTGVPSSRVPVASQPRIKGNDRGREGWGPIPLRVKMSCQFRPAAVTFTFTQPSGTDGTGRCPSRRPERGSWRLALGAQTAKMVGVEWSRSVMMRD